MAFADDIVLKDASSADQTFARQAAENNRCTWINTSTTALEPRLARISHRREATKQNPGEFQDRHTVEFSLVKKDTTTGKLYTAVAAVSIQMPLTGPIVRADLDNLLAFLKNATAGFIVVSTNVDKLLRNEL